LTETDNPGGYKWFAQEPGMPLVIKDVMAVLAEIRKIAIPALSQTVYTNFSDLIRGDPHLSDLYSNFFEPMT